MDLAITQSVQKEAKHLIVKRQDEEERNLILAKRVS
jgi:hypothetical protein